MVKKNRVTLQTIADKLGISKYAVSLAYRNHPRISEKTRKKVFELGASLNYHPSHLGQALAHGKSFKIAVLIPDSEQIGAMRQALQCQTMLWDLGYAAVILAGNSVEFQRKILHQLQAHHYVWKFSLDSTSIIPTQHSPAGLMASSMPLFSWSFNPNASKYQIEVRTNNSSGAVVRNQTNFGASSTNAGFSALEDGSYVWRVRAWKSIPGTWQVWSSFSSFTIDTTGPVISSVTYPPNLLFTNKNSCRMSWTAASDPSGVATYELVLNGSAFDIGNVTSYLALGLNQGTNRWSVRSRDVLGNWGSPTAQRTIVVDSLSPASPDGMIPANGVLFTNHWPLLEWNPVSDANGISGYEVQLDGNIYTAAVDSFQPLIPLASGAHVWKVRAVDTFGNRSAFSLSNAFTLFVDQTGPSAPMLVSPLAGSTTSDLKPLFIWTRVTDPSGILGYKIVINNVTNLLPASSTNFQPASSLSPGTCQWTVFALDTLGNPGSAQAPASFTIQSQGDISPVGNGFSIAPNPFKRSLADRLVIRFNPENSSAKIDFTIYTLSGQLVKRLVALPGSNQIEWFGENSQGNNVASGTYFVIMRVNNKSVGKAFKLAVIN
jgi:hypothetical protein